MAIFRSMALAVGLFFLKFHFRVILYNPKNAIRPNRGEVLLQKLLPSKSHGNGELHVLHGDSYTCTDCLI